MTTHAITIDGKPHRVSERVAALLSIVLDCAEDIDAYAVGELRASWSNAKVWSTLARSRPPLHLTGT